MSISVDMYGEGTLELEMLDHDKARLTHVTMAAAYDARSTSLDWLRARKCAELTRSAHARSSVSVFLV